MKLITYPFVHLPEYYTSLLCANMHAGGQGIQNLVQFIWENKGLYHLVKNSLKDLGKNLNVDEAIQSIGWHGLRDRLAASFLYYQQHGHFPDRYQSEIISELLSFEDKLTHYTVEGYSRSFLMAFYLKMALIHLNKTSPDNKMDNLLIGDEVIGLLKKSKTKIVKIDWVVLSLLHFKTYLGKEKIGEELEKGSSFIELLRSLKDEEKHEMVGNLLSYGSSIQDGDFLGSHRV